MSWVGGRIAVGVGRHRSSRGTAAICDNDHGLSQPVCGRRWRRQATVRRLSCASLVVSILGAAALLAVVIGLVPPGRRGVGVADPPPDPAEAARAAAALSRADGSAARPDPAEAARAVGRYYASFGDARPIPPPAVTAPPASAPAETDRPTWAAALIAGVLAASPPPASGVIAGRRTVRFRHG